MKKMMMTAPAILLGLLLMGTETGSAQMSSTSTSSGSVSMVRITTPSDQTGVFHVDRFEKRGRKVYAVGWFGSASDTVGRYSIRSMNTNSAVASSTSIGTSVSRSYGLSGRTSGSTSLGLSSGSFGGGSSFSSGSSSDATTDMQTSSSYDEEQAIMYDLPGDRIDGFGNTSPLDDMHENYMGTGTSDDDLVGTTDAIHEPLVDVQKGGPLVDVQSNGQAVTGIDLNAPRLDVRDTLISLRNDINIESQAGRQPLIDAEKDGPLLDLQSNGDVFGIDVNLPRFDVRDTLISLRDDRGVTSSYNTVYGFGTTSTGPVTYHDVNGNVVSIAVNDAGRVLYYDADGDLVTLFTNDDGIVGYVDDNGTFVRLATDSAGDLAYYDADGDMVVVSAMDPVTLGTRDGVVSYYDEDGDLTYVNVGRLEESDGMVALPVTFYGASCDQIQLALGPADGTPTWINVGNPSTLDESSVGPFIVNLTSESTVRTVSDTQMSENDASLCMVSRLINGKASRTAIVDNLNKLIGAPVYGPERNGSMR